MSHSAPYELKILVERVVRPLPLPLVRQRRLRSEYLTHLEAIFAEELETTNDPAVAVTRAMQRFGDPAKISAELRETITGSERWSAMQEHVVAQRTAESVCRYSFRLTLLIVGFAPVLFLVVLLKHHFNSGQVPLLELRLLTGMTVFYIVFFNGFMWLGLNWGREWQRPSRNYAILTLYSIGLASIWPVTLSLMMLISGGSWDQYHNPKLSATTLLISGAVFTLVFGALAGCLHQRDTAYRHEWTKLQID